MPDVPPSPILSRLARVPLVGSAVRAAADYLAPLAADPFGPDPYGQPPANVPPPAYSTDQPIAPPPGGTPFREGYHDQTFVTAVPTPITYGGITLAEARSILEEHDSGVSFYRSSILAVAMTRFPEVYSALEVRCRPSIALPRQITGGTRGLPRIVREQTEATICPPRFGSSPYFPATLWGSIEIDLAMMGFSVLQHVYGEPDALGRRRMWTRRWPTWAVWFNAYRKTYIALTTTGPVDILNDGKFTLIGKTDMPHLQAALRPLLLPVFDAAQVVQARADWLDKYSDPKWIGHMPEGQGPRTPEGKAFYEALRTMQAPGGVGAFPHGSEVTIQGLSAEASACFKEALDSDNGYIAKVLIGFDADMSGGVYKPIPMTSGLLHSAVGDDIAATVRGVNVAIGHEVRFNYGDAIKPADYPALSIPLPDPEADARFDAKAKRQAAYTAQIKADRDAGLVVDEDRNALLASELGAIPGVLAERSEAPVARLDLAPTDIAKVVRVDEARRSRDLPPIGDERGDLTIVELDQQAKAQPAEAVPPAEQKQEEIPA